MASGLSTWGSPQGINKPLKELTKKNLINFLYLHCDTYIKEKTLDECDLFGEGLEVGTVLGRCLSDLNVRVGSAARTLVKNGDSGSAGLEWLRRVPLCPLVHNPRAERQGAGISISNSLSSKLGVILTFSYVR